MAYELERLFLITLSLVGALFGAKAFSLLSWMTGADPSLSIIGGVAGIFSAYFLFFVRGGATWLVTEVMWW
ncbi:hypothetical protein BQ9231_00580 [Cedratvirus lausannensis]|uniref:Uncharacterized protein n=1 Tax=Cedratvirus lausannensis TaxID=2023205 RepID=A0A285PXR7_9VIRU|nr:hypothetical protein BQ9231_00580 [Cedratvirus lausannensis]